MKGDIYEFVIPIKPIGKARPRFASIKKKDGSRITRVYSTQETEEGLMLLFMLNKWKDKEPLTGPLRADFEFMFKRPKSHWGTGRNSGVLKKSAPKLWHIQKPDFDNICKIICDSINLVIYMDDAQICSGSFDKWWQNDPNGIPYMKLVLTELE